ncbi:MAG TPA: cytochrome P460 family protein [Pedobacter sp.]
MKSAYLLLPALILSLSACSGHKDSEDQINKEASLPASFNFSKMGLKVITSSINQKLATMSTIYGNDLALETAKTGKSIRPGETLAMIIWKQQEDQRWFGAKIPGKIQSLEMIRTMPDAGNGTKVVYQRFEGPQLVLKSDTTGNAESIKYIFAQQPSVMP